MRFMRHGLVCCTFLAAAGCGGFRVPLPAVDIEIGPSAVVEFGPAPGVPGGAPLNAARLELEANCVLPTEDEMRALLVESVGGLLAGFVRIERIDFAGMTTTAESGAFNTLSRVALFLQTDTGLSVSLGESASMEGLGESFTIAPDLPVDLLPLLQAADGGCVTPVLEVDGRVPRTPVSFRNTLTVLVQASAGL